MMPKVFLHLGIQVQINIANCKERAVGLRLLGFEKKPDQKTYHNVQRPGI